MIGKNCVDPSCLTALSADCTDSASCNNYKTGCVVNNNAAGCIDLPPTCSGRKVLEDCEIE